MHSKRYAKLLTLIGLTTKYAVCRKTSMLCLRPRAFINCITDKVQVTCFTHSFRLTSDFTVSTCSRQFLSDFFSDKHDKNHVYISVICNVSYDIVGLNNDIDLRSKFISPFMLKFILIQLPISCLEQILQLSLL